MSDIEELSKLAVHLATHGVELRHKQYRDPANPLAGLCYVICEALWHFQLKGRGWMPARMVHEDVPHWFLHLGRLDAASVMICDPTASQFKRRPPYQAGRTRSFLTREPSKRAHTLILAMQTELSKRGG